jgi:hypothetical protein
VLLERCSQMMFWTTCFWQLNHCNFFVLHPTKLADEGETLPIIMDDILVNFDSNRSQYATEAIMELVENHQILFYTCHPETIEVFMGHDKNIPVYRIDEGEFRVQ